jgi:hypothetical protein
VQQWRSLPNLGIKLDRSLEGHSADGKRTVPIAPNVAQLVDAIDVDQHRRLNDPEVHSRDQALTTGKKLCLVPVLGY